MPWGGHRLRHWVQADFPPEEKIGEAWLLSDHPHQSSVVANGPLAGMTLGHLIAERSEELLGWKTDRFPLLIKLLDANENLSIQVHPDDELARTYAPKEGGKTEAWYVLEADARAGIYLGLRPGAYHDLIRQAIAQATLPDRLLKYHPKPGDCYFVPAGTVHALGGGTVVLEVQQTSDATFRLFDWGRVGPDGKPRMLHIDEGLACVQDALPGAGLCAVREMEDHWTRHVDCSFFSVDRHWGPGEVGLSGPDIVVGLAGIPRLGEGKLNPGQAALYPAGINHWVQLNQGEALAVIHVKNA